jgi:hypothetical protein
MPELKGMRGLLAPSEFKSILLLAVLEVLVMVIFMGPVTLLLFPE